LLPRKIRRLFPARSLGHTQAAGHTVSGSLNSDFRFSRLADLVDREYGSSSRRERLRKIGLEAGRGFPDR
jgi:hypothetical protein